MNTKIRKTTLCKSAILAIAILPFSFISSSLYAADVSWLANPGSGEYGNASNWSSGSVPGQTDVSVFGASTQTTISVSTPGITQSGGWRISAGPPFFTFDVDAAANVQFYGDVALDGLLASVNNSGKLEFFNVNASDANLGYVRYANDGFMDFFGGSAGSASLVNNGTMQFFFDSDAGDRSLTNNDTLNFANQSTTGGSAVTNNSTMNFKDNSAVTSRFENHGQLVFSGNSSGGGRIFNYANTVFQGNSSAGNRFLENYSQLSFLENATGGSVELTNAVTATVDISGISTAGITFGSIAGAGAFVLGNKELETGSDNKSTTVSGVISGVGGSLEKVGTGTLTLSGANTYTGLTTITGGTVAVTNDNALGAAAGAVNLSGGTLLGTADISLVKDSFNTTAGTASRVSANNGTTLSLVGDLNIQGIGSTLRFGQGGQAGTVVVSSSSGGNNTANASIDAGTLRIGGADAGSDLLSGLAGTQIASGATLDIGGFMTEVRELTGAGIVSNSGANNMVILTGSGTSVFSGTIEDGAGSVGLLRGTSGTTILTGTNTYTGGTLVNDSGTLQIGNGGTTGSIVSDVNNHGSLIFNRSDASTYAGVISDTSPGVTGTVTKTGAGTLTLVGDNTYGGTTTINAGTLQIGNGGTSGSITGNVTNNGNLVFNRSNSSSYGGVISGSGSLSKQGVGELVLTGNQVYTGATTISNGTLQIGNGGTTGSIGGNITNNASLVFNRSDAVTYASIISGSGAVTKAGAGTLTLINSHTYTGGTTISGGTLQIGNGGATGSIAGNVLNNASLVFNRSDAMTFGGNISGTGSVTQAGADTLTLTGNNTYTGDTTVSDGELVFNGGTNTIGGIIVEDGDLAIQNGGSVSNTNGYIGYDVDSTATVTVDGIGSAWTNSGFIFLGGALGNGRLIIQNGGSVSNTFAHIGDWGGTTGTVTVDGIGSAWTNSDELVVGLSGDGSLTIQNGGSVSNTIGYIGDWGGTTGTVKVEGIGSAWVNSSDLAVGLSGDGSLTIQNGGSVSNILGHIGYFSTSTGTVTVDGAGSAWVNSSDLVVGLSGNGTLTIQNGGSVSNDWGHIGYDAGSTGTVTVDGAGSAWANSALIAGYYGNGSLAIQNGGSASSNDGAIGYFAGSTGTVTVDGAGSAWTTSSALSVGRFGSGTLTIRNSGSVSAASISLGLSGGNGTLNIGNGGAAGILNTTNVTSGAGAATLNFNHSDANYFFTNNGTAGGSAVAITGSTSVNHIGTGTTILTGAHTYTGATTINGGILAVNGSIVSDTTINAGGTLGGAGTVGNVTINGGTLAPGNSIGTLNVAGNVDFSGGGIYAVEVNAAGNADLINATGTATLTNGAVSVIPEAGNYNLSTDYTILTAAGGLGGTTFNSVSSTLAFLTPTLSYDANNVFLNLERNDVSFAAVAGTPNQSAVGTLINTLSNTNPEGIQAILDNLFILTAAGANQAYDSLSGVQHTHGNLIALQSINQFKGILFDRIQGNNQFQANNGQIMLAYHDTGTMTDAGNQLFDNEPQTNRGWWLRGTGNFGDIEDTRNATGASYKAGGIAAGLDFDFTPDLTAGAAIGYTRTDADVANGGLDVDSYQAALYGKLNLNEGYYLSAMTGLGYHDMESNRNVTVGLLNTSAEADYDAWTGNIAIEGGRTFTLNTHPDTSTSLTPFAGLEYAHIKRDSFTEKDGGATNLSVNQDTQDSLRSSIGARITHSWIAKGTRITPSAELAWVHEFMEDEAGIRAGFTTAPTTTFSVDGPDLARDRARLALGLNVQLNDTAYLNLGYQGEFASSDDRHDIAATFRMMW